MIKISPNEKCPCGSNLKYKKCYKTSTNCKLFEQDRLKNLLTTHQSKEKEIVEFLTEIVGEVNGTFRKHDNGNDLISVRIQMVVCFSIIDVFASYWNCYLADQTDTQSSRANIWLEKFCFVENNKEYTKERFGKLDIELFIKLRNSIVHFFALPNATNPGIVLMPNNFSDDMAKDHKRRFKNRGVDILYLKPIWINHWLVEGAKIMLLEMIKNIELSKIDDSKGWEHINGINRIYEKTQVEGAKRIDLEKYNEII